MSRISDKNIFLINAEYITKKIKVRAVFYATILILVLTSITISRYRFSVDLSFEGTVSQTSELNLDDSTKTLASKLVEIHLNQALSDILKNRKNIQIEFLEENIPIYRCKGEIIQYSTLSQTDKENKCTALIAKTTLEDQIELFQSDLPANCKAEIIIPDVRISLNDLLSLITLKNLFSIEINHFS